MAANSDGTDSAESQEALVFSVTSHTRRLCELCLRVLPVQGASVVVRSGVNHREMVYATDDVIVRLDDLQFVLGEGPCLDAYRHRFPVMAADLGSSQSAERWPGYAREATSAGAAAVFAFPLQVGAIPFGILELYRRTAGALDEAQTATALLIVDDIVRVVLQELASVQLSPTPTHPTPLFGHAEIPQATGMVAVQLNVSIPEALAQLRAAAFVQNRTVQQVAEDIVARRFTFATAGTDG